MRAMPPGRAASDSERRGVFSAAIGQFDELLDAAKAVGPASRPLPLYYALNQAGRAIAAALLSPDRPWRPSLHGLSIRGPKDGALQDTTITPQNTSDDRPGSFDLLAEVVHGTRLTSSTELANVWAAIPGLDRPGLGAGCPRALPIEPVGGGDVPVLASLRGLEWLPVHPSSEERLHEVLATTYPRYHTYRGRRGDHGRRAVVAVHQEHVRSHRIAADLDVFRQPREEPDAAAAIETASGLEVHGGADQLVDELERLDVLDDPVIRSCG